MEIAGLCSSKAQWPLAPNFRTHATRKTYSFFMLIICWAPWILQAQSTWISVIFLEHSLGQIVPIMILTGLVYPVSSGTLYRIVQT